MNTGGLGNEDGLRKAKEFVQITHEESERVLRLAFSPHRVNIDPSFYEEFALRGIRVDRVEPGLVSSSFKVPPRLTDRNGEFPAGAIANVIDVVASALVHVEGTVVKSTVDMSISYLSSIKLQDELEITARVLGQRGVYSGINVVVRNKSKGELVAEGRVSFFSKPTSKI